MPDAAKAAAGRAAARMVQDGWRVGLGTGSTAVWAIRALGERAAQGLNLLGVATSEESAALARDLGIPLAALDEVDELDVVIDGADEIDPEFRLIKGGGGALVREKLVAVAARRMFVVAGAGKRVEHLGVFPLPVAVLPFGHQRTLARLRHHVPDAGFRLRDGEPCVSDDGHFIADLRCGRIADPEALYRALKCEPGVVDVGLFLGIATHVVLGREDGSTEVLVRPDAASAGP